MRILVIGQCTLHIGRMEFGNIGNYYIIEPFVRELLATFPGAEIRTTLQMSDEFCVKEHITRLPMSLYYGWSEADLPNAMLELSIAELFSETGKVSSITPYIEEVMNADLVIDFSGDIWGDNANFLGANRFLIGLYKDRIAQLLGKKVVMLAGSPGPFGDETTKAFAKEVFENFDLVTNREPSSRSLMEKEGFNTTRLADLACPAFLFEPAPTSEIEGLLQSGGLLQDDKPLVGFVLCGWNFTTGPFDKWPREDNDYQEFAEAIEFLIGELGTRVCLVSHANGFTVPAPPFQLTHGRDYPVIKQLQSVLAGRGVTDDVFSLDGIYKTWETKTIIGSFDMLVSGRVHAAVAGLSQSVPTVVIDYGHEPKAHKLRGFAKVAGMQNYVADPANGGELKERIEACWKNRYELREQLDAEIPLVKALARENFTLLKDLF